MTAAVEVGAIRWVAAATPLVEEPEWIETFSEANDLATSSREPAMTSTTTKAGELELVPVQ